MTTYINTITGFTNCTSNQLVSTYTSGTGGIGGILYQAISSNNVIVANVNCSLPAGAYVLPDGAILTVDNKGNYTINDKDAKVIYKGNPVREFNKYVNASDLIEEFISDIGKLGITQSQLLKLPINAFFVWLVAKAAEADGETLPADVPKIESLQEIQDRVSPPISRCKHCGKFISNEMIEAGLNFCNAEHFEAFRINKFPERKQAYAQL